MDNDDEMTVVYRVEPLNENEAAFLPQDLPEVVLDGSNMTTDTIMAEPRTRTLPNGGIRSSYSESTYSPEVGFYFHKKKTERTTIKSSDSESKFFTHSLLPTLIKNFSFPTFVQKIKVMCYRRIKIMIRCF